MPATVPAAAHPSSERPPVLELGLRLSVVAMWALVAVSAAGVVMALMISTNPAI